MHASISAAAEGSRFVGGASLTLVPDVLMTAAPSHSLVEGMEEQAARLIPELAENHHGAAAALFAHLLACGPPQVNTLSTLRSYAMAPLSD